MEGYFESQAFGSVTSDRTLAKLEMPRMDTETLTKTLQGSFLSLSRAYANKELMGIRGSFWTQMRQSRGAIEGGCPRKRHTGTGFAKADPCDVLFTFRGLPKKFVQLEFCFRVCPPHRIPGGRVASQ